MKKINLIQDYWAIFNNEEKEHVLIVDDRDSLFRTLNILSQDDENDYTVILRNAFYHNQFVAPYSFHGEINKRIISPSSVLMEKTGEIMPEWLTDEIITELGLLKSVDKVEKIAGSCLQGWLLDLYLYPELTIGLQKINNLSTEEIEQRLIKAALQISNKEKLLWEKFLSEVSNNNRAKPELKRLISLIGSEPDKMATALLGAILFRSYPDHIWMTWIDNNMAIKIAGLRGQVNQDWLDNLPVDDKVLDKHWIASARAFLRDHLKVDGLEAIQYMSGHFSFELDELYGWLDNNPQYINEDVINQIEDVFKRISNLDLIVEKLRMYVRDDTLISQPPGRGWNDMKSWAENSYFPYWEKSMWIRNWEQLEGMAELFENWLLTNDYVHTDENIGVAGMSIVAKKWFENGNRIIFLIIDGFNWIVWQRLKRMVLKKGWAVENEELRTAILPTITEFGKRVLVVNPDEISDVAIMENEDISINSEEEIFAYGASYSSYTTLDDIARTNCCFVEYFYNDIDDLIHHSSLSTNLWEKINKKLAYLIQEIDSFLNIQREMNNENWIIIITGDHGWTYLPPDVKNIEENNVLDKVHTRTLVCTDKMLNPMDGLEYLRKINNHHYYICRGYTLIGKNRNTGVHGGILPEEVLVPCAVVRPGYRNKINELIIKFMDCNKKTLELDRSSNNAVVMLYNNNGFKIAIEDLEIHGLEVIFNTTRVDLAPYSNCEIGVQIDCEKFEGEYISISVNYIIKAENDRMAFFYETELPFKRAARHTSFDDEFDF